MSSSHSVTSKADQLRAELNLKNLKRHDNTIDKIIASTPYVTVYYNTGQEWIKTGIEGPMFLFSRSIRPQFGFFVLNRQGLEYVQEFLTPEADVKVEGQFILFEPHQDAERATGIWIAEERDRIDLCRQMQEICAHVTKTAAPPPPSSTLPLKQSIPLDMLFGASRASEPRSVPQSVPAPPPSTSIPALDMLFASSASSPPAPAEPPLPATLSPASGGMALLDSIFKSASLASPPAPAPAPAPASVPPANDARALLAMLGHTASPPTQSAAPLPEVPAARASQPQSQPQSQPRPKAQEKQPVAPATASKPTAPSQTPLFAPPLLSHDVFATLPMPAGYKSKPKSPVNEKMVKSSQAQPPKPSQPQSRPQAPPHSARRDIEPVAGQSARLGSEPDSSARLSNGTSSTAARTVKKGIVLDLVDTLASSQKIGMTNGDGAGAQDETLSQDEFIARVRDLLADRAWQIRLYARYLDRVDSN